MSDIETTSTLTDQDFADLGRAIVTHVHNQLAPRTTEDHWNGRKALEHRGLRVTMRFSPPAGENLWPPVCCICVLDEGIVICRGPCCEDW